MDRLKNIKSLLITEKFTKKGKKRSSKKCKEEKELRVGGTLKRYNLTSHQNLRTLVIIGQPEIKSLDVVGQLCNLQELWIVECSLKNISLLQNNNSLEKLYLYSNIIEEVPNLSNMTKLNILSLARNKITDLSGFREVVNLEDLNVADNKISNIDDVFSSESKLMHVNLSENPIQNLQAVQNLWVLKNLRKIEFDDPVYGKCPLVENHFNYRQYLIRILPGLQEIDYFPIGLEEREKAHTNEMYVNEKILKNYKKTKSINSNFFKKFLRPDEFSHIKHLQIINSSISQDDLPSIFLPQLESLDLSKNLLENLQGLKNMEKLHTLCVSQNRIGSGKNHYKKLSSPDKKEFPSMTILYADHNEISALGDGSIPNMPTLKYIFLQHNKIHDITGVKNFLYVNTLVLDNNNIENIENQFRFNVYLKNLFLENNELTSLMFVNKIRNIEKLYVAKNKIQDVGELSHLSGPKYLTELRIHGNPVCSKCNYFKEIRAIKQTLKTIDGHST